MINQVSHVVRAVRPNECIVRAQRLLQDVALPSNHAFLFTARNLGSHTNGREKCGNSRAERAHALAQNSLRHKFKLDFSGVELFLKIFCARPGKRRHDSANLPVLK